MKKSLAGKAPIIAGIILALPMASGATSERSAAQRAAFVRETPCPATDQQRGPCPGYVVDHIIPLCAGGADAPGNMQWQTIEQGKLKDKAERDQCRK